jgi:heme-degrading monooxygenase HmoA
MIVRIVFFSASPDAFQKGIRIWDEEMPALLKKQKGFIKAYRADAKDEPGGVVIQLWENKKDEEAWRSSPDFQGVARKVGSVLPELSIERDFEVVKEV